MTSDRPGPSSRLLAALIGFALLLVGVVVGVTPAIAASAPRQTAVTYTYDSAPHVAQSRDGVPAAAAAVSPRARSGWATLTSQSWGRPYGSAVAAETDGGLVTVGRWMSPAEHDAMVADGRVQPGLHSPHTDVSFPASPTTFTPTNPLSTRYVEFDVPRSSLVQGGKVDWAHIPGPDSIFSRLASRGGVPYEYPAAQNINWVASWNG